MVIDENAVKFHASMVSRIADLRFRRRAVRCCEPGTYRVLRKAHPPLLAAHCYPCHSSRASTVFGEFRLDSAEALLEGGRSGPAVVPGDPDASRLIRAVRMTPKESPCRRQGNSATGTLKRSRNGCVSARPGRRPAPKHPRNASAGAAKVEDGHWAWQQLSSRAPPKVTRTDWPLGNIDRFVLAKLESKGLAPVEQADRYTLLRRLALDLTGLPPTQAQIQEFETAPWPHAIETAVDRFLASPAFGERWGRHWLDLAGYADNLGIGRRIPSPLAWRYRDYVIDAFNRDKPVRPLRARTGRR